MTETDQAALAELANAGDVAAQFNLNLLLDRESGTDQAAPTGLSELPMRKLARRLLPGVPRSMSRVQPGLVNLFHDLATGKARWPLLLHGDVGTGKTAAAICLCDFAEKACYATLDALCDAVMGNGTETAETAWSKIRESDLVVIDEIGARERVGDLYLSTLQRVSDERERWGEHRLIAISNVSPEELGDVLDDRCVSRLARGTIFELKDDDRRRSKAASQASSGEPQGAGRDT